MKRTLFHTALLAAAALATTTFNGSAQELTGPPANPDYKYSTAMPPGVTAPDKIESRLGTLNLFDAIAPSLWRSLA